MVQVIEEPHMSTKLTGAQLAQGILALLPALNKIQAVMATPQFKDAEVIAEDVLKILSMLEVPGAAVVEEGIEIASEIAPGALAVAKLAVPIIANTLPLWLNGNPFAAAPGGWLGAPRATGY